jgi:hypothetical protein
MAASGAAAPAYPGLRGAALALLAAAFVLGLVQGAGPLPALTAAGRPAAIDASGAHAFLAFCRSLREGQPWDDAAIHEMVASPPYRTMIAHHATIDPTVTPEAFAAMLRALRDGQPYTPPPGRLTRIHVTYSWACEELPAFEARLQAACAAPIMEQALARAQSHLPPGTPLDARVYLLADGYSAAYPEGNTVVLDLLQMRRPEQLEAWLAHELHHIGANSLLPPACADPELGLALDTLAGLMQEGAATSWIDGWRAKPTAADYAAVAAYLRDTAAGTLAAEDAGLRLAAILDDGRDGRGPLYRVGNAMVTTLSAIHGEPWLRARLGDPVGLLRAWQEAAGSEQFAELLALLDEGRARCPAWLGGAR